MFVQRKLLSCSQTHSLERQEVVQLLTGGPPWAQGARVLRGAQPWTSPWLSPSGQSRGCGGDTRGPGSYVTKRLQTFDVMRQIEQTTAAGWRATARFCSDQIYLCPVVEPF